MATREQVVQALFDRLKARVTGLKTTERRYIDPNDITPDGCPAMILLVDAYESREPPQYGAPPIRAITAVLYFYTVYSEGDASPETPLNAIVEQVEAAMQRDPTTEPITDMSQPSQTNLGGLCKRAYISGNIDLIPGEVGKVGSVLFPIDIILP